MTNRQFHRRRKKRRSHRLRTTLLVFCGIAVIGAGIFALLLHKPADFVQPKPIEDNEVSKYLTHVLSRDLYNGAQREEPFKLVISQEGINDIVSRFKWPQEAGGLSISVPEVIFERGTIMLRGVISTAQLELLVTVSGTAFTNEEGLLNLVVRNIKVGALNITVLAKALAQSLYEDEMANREPKPDGWSEKIFAAILQGEPFDPVLKVEDKRIRIAAVDIAHGRMTIYMVPADKEPALKVSKGQENG